MEVIRIETDHIPLIQTPSIACIGYFDGLHKGHQKLIETTIRLCCEDVTPAVICFDEDPWVIMHKVTQANYITPQKERLHRLQQLGIKRCFLLHFDKNMLQMSKQDFITHILEKLNLQALVCGEDFHFAYKGEGSVSDLENRSFALHALAPICFEDKKISSSQIEEDIQQGKMEAVTTQLGQPYYVKGHIVHGNRVGSAELGFPTANLQLDENYIIPKQGVYAGVVTIANQNYAALINIGHNPTMNYQKNISIEAHILDFNQDIYGTKVSFAFFHYIREEKKFTNVEALIAQLQEDVKYVKEKRM